MTATGRPDSVSFDVEDLLEPRPCETTFGCDETATVMIWASHHVQGCEYTGFRCDVHFNLLHLETMRLSRSVASGALNFCARCGVRITSPLIADHLRWVRL